MEETTVLNINTKTSNYNKEETLIIKSSEKVILSENTIDELRLQCPFCKSKKIFLQIPEFNFIKLQNDKTNRIRGADLNYFPILFCDQYHPFCSICHEYPHIGKNCNNEEETTLKNIFSILEILENDVPNNKSDRFMYLRKKSLEKSTNATITVALENEIKEEYTSLSITLDEKFPLKNSSIGYIKCPKCLKCDSNLELIIPKYDFMQIEDIKTKQRIWKPMHYFPNAICIRCNYPICTICSKECHPKSLCNDKNLDVILNIQKQLDYLQANVPESKQERFKELRVIAYRHATDYLEYKNNPSKLPKTKVKLINDNNNNNNIDNKNNTDNTNEQSDTPKESSVFCMCCENCKKNNKCSCSCVAAYFLVIFLCILYTPIFLSLFGLSIGIVLLSLAFKILSGIYFCFQRCCCVREVGRETDGNVTTIYLDGDYINQIEKELKNNCEFFTICGQNCYAAIMACAIKPYYKIVEKFTENL